MELLFPDGFTGIAIIMIVAVLVLQIAWILTIVKIIRSDMHRDDKLLWLLVVIFMQILGMMLYYIVGPKSRPVRQRY